MSYEEDVQLSEEDLLAMTPAQLVDLLRRFYLRCDGSDSIIASYGAEEIGLSRQLLYKWHGWDE